jgi:hypothetical protein
MYINDEIHKYEGGVYKIRYIVIRVIQSCLLFTIYFIYFIILHSLVMIFFSDNHGW